MYLSHIAMIDVSVCIAMIGASVYKAKIGVSACIAMISVTVRQCLNWITGGGGAGI